MKPLRQLVEPLYTLRNRVAHHEPVYYYDQLARRDDAIRIIEISDPALGAWVKGHCRVGEVTFRKPDTA